MYGYWSVDYHTENANTAIVDVIPPVSRRKPCVNAFAYGVGTTAHTLTFMKACGQTTASAAAAAGQKDISLTSIALGFDSSGAAESLAAGDWLVWRDSNGAFIADVIASVADLVVTMTANLPAAIAAGAKVWAFYEVGRGCHHTIIPAVSALFEIHGDNLVIGGITPQKANHASSVRSGDGDPMIFHSTNATAAGFLQSLSGQYLN